MNWIVAIIVGGLAGWIAEKLMKSDMGLLMNIVLGIVGAFIANLILTLVNVDLAGAGWIGYLIAGILGACLLIFVARLIKGRGATRT
jgi:uncharacterized membrane protein YeaQ/YmgE (transglycosylase-associated protein family)